jgi:hypothetical protein
MREALKEVFSPLATASSGAHAAPVQWLPGGGGGWRGA